MYGRNSALGTPYNYTFTFPPLLTENKHGVYEINFYIYYLCDGLESDCRNMDESISMRINELEVVYGYEELIDNPTWAEKKILYDSKSSDIKVIEFFFYFNTFGFY